MFLWGSDIYVSNPLNSLGIGSYQQAKAMFHISGFIVINVYVDIITMITMQAAHGFLKTQLYLLVRYVLSANFVPFPPRVGLSRFCTEKA